MTGKESKYYSTSVANPRSGQECRFTIPTRYSDLKFLGGGAQGWVVSAYDSAMKCRVAIKKLRNPFVMELAAKRTYREFMLLMSFNHPNIIQLHNAFTPQKDSLEFRDLYFVTEAMDRDLHYVIKTKRLDHTKLSYLVYQLLCALKHLHASGIIHRDVKPENIVVRDDGCKLKILDFGLARRNDYDTAMRMTAYVVTRWYRAPEVILDMQYCEKVDVWSVGCILAELLTGSILFPGMDHIDQWRSIVKKMGTPQKKFIDRLAPHVGMFLRAQQRYSPVPMEQLIPDQCFEGRKELAEDGITAHSARDLISKMLVIDPEERCSVDEALQHPYVRPWFEESDVDIPLPQMRYTSNDEKVDRSIQQWKDLLFKELELYATTHDVFGDRGTLV